MKQNLQTKKKVKTPRVYRDRNQNVQGHIVAFPTPGYDPMPNNDRKDKVVKPKKKGRNTGESPNAERDDFIIQDKLRQAVEERAARERETRKRRLKSFITYVVIAVVSIFLVWFLIFPRKML